MVLCVDEKARIQALHRAQLLLPMRPGQIERRTHDEDGRARCVHLTVKGRRLQRRLHESAKVLHQRLHAIATPQEFKSHFRQAGCGC